MMAPSERDKIRERENALFRVSETILAIALVLTVLFGVSLRVNSDFMGLWPLKDASNAFALAAQASGDSLPQFAEQALSWQHTPEAAQVRTIIAIDNPTLPGMRAFVHDSLVGITRGLDTTHIEYVIRSGEVREEFYLSPAEQLLADRLRKAWFPWFVGGVEMLMMAILFAFHRWVKSLLKEE